jgi:hypothetical protein
MGKSWIKLQITCKLLTEVDELLAREGRGVELRVIVQHLGYVPDSQGGPHPEAAYANLA